MSHKFQSILALAGTLTFTIFLSSTVQAQDTGWKAKWDKIVEAANKEGQVNTWGLPDITHPAIIQAFNKRYPKIKVVTVSGHTGEFHRLVAERRARKYLADVYASGPAIVRQAYINGFLEPLRPHLILPDVTDQSKWYGGKHIWGDPENKFLFLYEGTPASASMAYNTKKMPKLAIKSYWDVLDPKYRGDIGFFSYGGGGIVPTPMLAMYYNPLVGPKFLERLFGEMELSISRNRRQTTDWLARGKYTLCFMCRGLEIAQKAGLPVKPIRGEQLIEAGALAGGNSSQIGFIKDAPHPNAAIVFINWILSRDGQKEWQRFMNTVAIIGSQTLREDLPNDDVLAPYRRTKGKVYPVLGFLDPRPVVKWYWLMVRKAIAQQGDRNKKKR